MRNGNLVEIGLHNRLRGVSILAAATAMQILARKCAESVMKFLIDASIVDSSMWFAFRGAKFAVLRRIYQVLLVRRRQQIARYE